MKNATIISLRQHSSVTHEIEQLIGAFKGSEVKVTLLKGAAYITANLKAHKGRLLSDIDILVPKQKLPIAEKMLSLKGWISTHHDEYDDRYYRKWMHEIPPLVHALRQSNLDVHHTILPPTAKYHPAPEKLFDHSVKLADKNVYVLSPEDMVIHSATHLFHEGEFNHGLRDLNDIKELTVEFNTKKPDFWSQLIPRAIELDLIRPLFYALRYADKILWAPIPASTMQVANAGRPNKLTLILMDFLFTRALAPNHSTCYQRFTWLARWLLYIRSHYLRMPLYLLIPHLIIKGRKKRTEDSPAEAKMNAHDADDIGENPL